MALLDVNGFGMNVDILPGILPMDTVFLHGNLASNAWWKPSVEVWKREARPSYEGRMIMAEWRGSGQSAHVKHESELEMANLAMDYVYMLRQMGVKKACLVGHSTGGLIGMIAMLKAPELFDRAVLLDPVPAEGAQFAPEMYAAFTQMSQSMDVCTAVMSSTIYNNDLNSPVFKQITQDAFNLGKLNWHGVPKALSHTNISEEVGQISQPVLVLHGEHDPILPLEGSARLASQLGSGTLRELKGQGHSTNVENPALFVQSVNDFLFNRA